MDDRTFDVGALAGNLARATRQLRGAAGLLTTPSLDRLRPTAAATADVDERLAARFSAQGAGADR